MLLQQVLDRERQFFDLEANRLSDHQLRMPRHEFARYRAARLGPDNIPKDTFFALAQPLAGKRVLDYGCGHGENVCLLAACGARVTGFDLSPQAIAKARRRAELHGLDHRTRLHVRAAGQTGYARGTFDIVLGYKILHHLHTMLRPVYAEIARLLAPGGTAYFIEPVANSACLRWLRRVLPVPCYATEDERQLTYEDFAPLKDYFRRYEIHHYYGLERLRRLVGERARRPLRRLDAYGQRLLPCLRRYYGEVLVVAQR